MIGKLRRRLTAVFTALTALVLAAALTVTFFLAQAQYEAGQQALFDAALNNVLEQLTQGSAVSDDWLARQEAAAGSVFYILDNGVPLHFTGGWVPVTPRQTLIDSALEQAARAGVVFQQGSAGEAGFLLSGGAGEQYRAAARCVPFLAGGAQKFVGVVMIQDLTLQQQHLRGMVLQYCFIWLAGAAALCLIIWLLAGFSLRPTLEALQRQTEFVAAASHELRSPLAVIKASLSAARQTAGQPEKEENFLRTAEREADRMTRLTNDLLVLAGGDAGVWDLQRAGVPLDTFCIELYDTFQPLAMERGHVLTLALPDDALPTVHADAERLTQLFGILLSNAMEYSPPGAPVELAARMSKKEVLLCVADHGPGIADAEKERVFRRFYRTDQSRSDKAHFGLGLSVAQEIAAMHGAVLALSDTPGGGATFTLHLPLRTG